MRDFMILVLLAFVGITCTAFGAFLLYGLLPGDKVVVQKLCGS